ncbi:hypothetical protein K470DRAFT_206840, partial [Piedraia hortae CBS 480.64]
YTDTHRAMAQALLARQVLDEEGFKYLIAKAHTAADPERPTLAADLTIEDVRNHMQLLNSKLSLCDFAIRSAKHQTPPHAMTYALVNLSGDDRMTEWSTAFTPDELAYIKRLLDAIFDTYNTHDAEVLALTSTQALRLAKVPAGSVNTTQLEDGTQITSNATSLTMTHAEKILELLLEQSWFEMSANGYYTLAPRALMELRSWLFETYNDDDDNNEGGEQRIKLCAACKEIVTMGLRCPNMDCNVRLHSNCVSNLFRAQGGCEGCPTCHRTWNDPLPVGETAVTGGTRTTAARR